MKLELEDWMRAENPDVDYDLDYCTSAPNFIHQGSNNTIGFGLGRGILDLVLQDQ